MVKDVDEERKLRQDLAHDHNKLKTLVISLVSEVGRLGDNVRRLTQRVSRNLLRVSCLWAMEGHGY